jgi:hypothetical protein
MDETLGLYAIVTLSAILTKRQRGQESIGSYSKSAYAPVHLTAFEITMGAIIQFGHLKISGFPSSSRSYTV